MTMSESPQKWMETQCSTIGQTFPKKYHDFNNNAKSTIIEIIEKPPCDKSNLGHKVDI